MAASDPAAAQEAMGMWMAWMEKAGPAIVDGGSPLGDPTVLPSNGGQGDGYVGGYSILQGESLEEITKLLDGHPHFHSPNASIEVREFLSMRECRRRTRRHRCSQWPWTSAFVQWRSRHSTSNPTSAVRMARNPGPSLPSTKPRPAALSEIVTDVSP
jgi:hypothetical protein